MLPDSVRKPVYTNTTQHLPTHTHTHTLSAAEVTRAELLPEGLWKYAEANKNESAVLCVNEELLVKQHTQRGEVKQAYVWT